MPRAVRGEHHLITERKNYEDNLKRSEKYLDNIINNIGDPVFVKDDQSKFVLINDAFRNLFNLPENKIIGKKSNSNFIYVFSVNIIFEIIS